MDKSGDQDSVLTRLVAPSPEAAPSARLPPAVGAIRGAVVPKGFGEYGYYRPGALAAASLGRGTVRGGDAMRIYGL
jgi:hypothetical protein